MTVIAKKIKLSTKGNTDIIDITSTVAGAISKTDIDNIIKQINNIDWNNNMNYKSISKPEINKKLEEILN